MRFHAVFAGALAAAACVAQAGQALTTAAQQADFGTGQSLKAVTERYAPCIPGSQRWSSTDEEVTFTCSLKGVREAAAPLKAAAEASARHYLETHAGDFAEAYTRFTIDSLAVVGQDLSLTLSVKNGAVRPTSAVVDTVWEDLTTVRAPLSKPDFILAALFDNEPVTEAVTSATVIELQYDYVKARDVRMSATRIVKDGVTYAVPDPVMALEDVAYPYYRMNEGNTKQVMESLMVPNRFQCFDQYLNRLWKASGEETSPEARRVEIFAERCMMTSGVRMRGFNGMGVYSEADLSKARDYVSNLDVNEETCRSSDTEGAFNIVVKYDSVEHAREAAQVGQKFFAQCKAKGFQKK